jgi:hypothetical protein
MALRAAWLVNDVADGKDAARWRIWRSTGTTLLMQDACCCSAMRRPLGARPTATSTIENGFGNLATGVDLDAFGQCIDLRDFRPQYLL